MKRGFKKILSFGLGICIACLPMSAVAHESNLDLIQEGNILEVPEMGTPILSKDDVCEEVAQMEDLDVQYVPNIMEKVYDGESVNVTQLPNDTTVYAAQTDEDNTDPNYAYLVENGNVVQGMLTQTGEMRWYGFILDQSSKVTILLQMVAEADADLYLFHLDQTTYELSMIGGSASYGLGTQEFYCDVLDAGIYYIAVGAYEGSGQFAFAFYATQDTNYEVNDSKNTAAEVSVNSTITGVIDTPYDVDYYKFTLSSPAIMRMTTDVSGYNFGYSSSSQFYKVSQYEDLYEFEAGTYYFAVYSSTGAYDANKSYKLTFNKVANIADDANSFYYMVNEKANVVFQCDWYGGSMYVNGNPIDISYKYEHNASNSAGLQSYSIILNNTSNLRAKIYQNQFLPDKVEQAQYYGMEMPEAVRFNSGTMKVGPTGTMLKLSVYAPEKFYQIHCSCTGAYVANNYHNDLNFVTVLIDPNTGKLSDIYYINYFYDYAIGSNSMSVTRPFAGHDKYYYPYYNGDEPYTW